MTRDDSQIEDWRSTGRRKARRALFNAYIPFKCVGWTNTLTGKAYVCGKTTREPPKDAPKHFDEIWPLESRVLNPQSLQADHESKDMQVNDIQDLNWRCASCHKYQDKQTAVGERTVSQNTGW